MSDIFRADYFTFQSNFSFAQKYFSMCLIIIINSLFTGNFGKEI